MSKYILILLTLWGSIQLRAQSLERYVFGVAGGIETVGTDTYIFHMGEAIVGTDFSTEPYVTQGFLQPLEDAILFNQIDLNGTFLGDGVLLSWNTSTIENTDRFEIRRIEENGSSTILGQLSAREQVLSYQFVDPLPRVLSERSRVYQITWIQVNGAQSQSNLLEIVFPTSTANIFLYPNPVSDILTVEVSLPNGEKGDIRMYDLQGRLLYQSGKLDHDSQFSLDAGKYSPGIYLISFSSPSHRQTRLLEILH
ncbi:MAG: T9SS type A sorting domain-containing protein [Bacteroidota bacterium]